MTATTNTPAKRESGLGKLHRVARRGYLAACMAAVVAAAMPAAVSADISDYALESVSASLSTTQAGAHPDVNVSFGLATDPTTEPDATGARHPFARTKDLDVELPPGLIGNPNAIPTCTAEQFATAHFGGGCPVASQVGTVRIQLYKQLNYLVSPIYNMEPPSGDRGVARLAFYAALLENYITVKVRSNGDYGLTGELRGAAATEIPVSASTTLWGVPSDPIHDSQRLTAQESFPNFEQSSPPRPTGLPLVPFMTNATRCGVAGEVRVSARSYQLPDRWSSMATTLPALTGCGLVRFKPELSVVPTSRAAASPSGLDVKLSIPHVESVNTLASGHLRNSVVTLPEGMTVSSSAADGLQACTAGEVGLGTVEVSRCPDGSKIGTATFDSPPLSRPLEGAIYQRAPEPGRLLRIWLVADDLGVHLKIPGELYADERTGQLTAVFTDNPQVPLREVDLHFKGGNRGVLQMPDRCGTYATRSELTPWSSDTAVVGSSSFVIDQGCGAFGSFDPQLSAGTTNPVAGDSGAFVLRVTRGDGQRNVSSLETTLPDGLLAKVAGVPLCSEAQAASGGCSAASQIGTTAVGSGVGSTPLYIPQPGKAPTAVYLAGPYKGAPYSVVIKVPAQAGPFDLGTIVVRAALHVDRNDAHATVKSDPLPQIIQGIPIVYRDIRVTVDRPGFMRNPTSCEPTAVDAVISGVGDSPSIAVDGQGVGYSTSQAATASRSSRFEVGDCAALAFTPKLALRATGRKQTRTNGHPGIRAVVTQATGQAAIGKAVVRLPKALALDPDNAQALCEFADGTQPDLENRCPKGSIVGRARAKTPLLDDDLVGDVYFVKNVRRDRRTGNAIRTLPMLIVALRGEIDINLKGTSSVSGGKLVNTFAAVPDAPVSRFNLNLEGGRNGILVVTDSSRGPLDLCRGTQVASVRMKGHNGKARTFPAKLKTPCKPKRAGVRRNAKR